VSRAWCWSLNSHPWPAVSAPKEYEMNYTRLRTFLVIASLGAVSLFTLAAHAQSTNRQIGTQLTVTADPLAPRPHTRSCVVPLFTNYQFAFFSGTTQNYQFTPPANCPGPWNKVVLDINFSENAGRQFDRTATLYMGTPIFILGRRPSRFALRLIPGMLSAT